MVGPAWRAQKHARIPVHRRNQLETEPERAATTRRLDACDPLVVGVLAEQDRADELRESLVARAPEIALALLRGLQDRFGLLDHLQHRRTAFEVAEHADADVDLVGPRIGGTERDQRKKRVLLDRRKIGKAPGLRMCFGQHRTAIS